MEIDYPMNQADERTISLDPFSRFPKKIADMDYRYTYTVRYTDLDKSRHMNNLLYINLFLNAFDLEFFEENRITDFEIHYLNQCFYMEDIEVYAKQEEDRILLAGMKKDGTLAVQGMVMVE